MSRGWMACALLSTLALPLAAVAQTGTRTMSPLEVAVACAPPPRITPPPAAALRIVGGQDTEPRTIFGTLDTLLIAGGTGKGVTLGQRYYVRRSDFLKNASMPTGVYNAPGHVTQTVGWVRIVSVNDATALATVEHACAVLTAGDYLEPFTEPTIPAGLTESTKLRELDFSSPARVLFGDLDHGSAGMGDFVLTDRGADGGATTGARFAIYRDLHVTDLPLASIGEAVVVSNSPDAAVLRIIRARDAVFSGDYLVPEKK